MVSYEIIKTVHVDLSLKELRVNKLYQRKLNKTKVNRFVRNYNHILVGSIVVCQDDYGDYWVVDGQHRLAMAIILNEKGKFPNTISCRLIKNKTVHEQSDIFKLLNSSVSIISVSDRIWADICSEDPDTLEIVRVLTSFNFRLGKFEGTEGDVIKANVAVIKIHKELNIDDFERLFRLLRKTWDGNDKSLHTHMLNGLSHLIKKTGLLFSDDDFVSKMRFVMPEEIMKVGSILASGAHATGKHYAISLLQYYNKGRTTKRIPDGLLFD